MFLKNFTHLLVFDLLMVDTSNNQADISSSARKRINKVSAWYKVSDSYPREHSQENPYWYRSRESKVFAQREPLLAVIGLFYLIVIIAAAISKLRSLYFPFRMVYCPGFRVSQRSGIVFCTSNKRAAYLRWNMLVWQIYLMD
jgi:hypothetical protein